MDNYDGQDADAFAFNNFGDPMLRLSFGVDMFFPRPMDAYREDVLGVWNALLDWRGRKRFTWARLGGGIKSRKMTPAAYRAVSTWLDGSRSYGDHCFVNIQDGDFEAMRSEAFLLDGDDQPHDEDDENDTQINHVQVRLPLSVLDDPVGLVRHLQTIVAPLRYVCASAGLMLHGCPFHRGNYWKQMHVLAARFEGVEPDMAEKTSYMAPDGIPGVNWLTFVGEPHLAKLGGKRALIDKSSALRDVHAAEVGRGVMVQAGTRPRIGDKTKSSPGLEPYRDVYALLRSVLYFQGDFGFDDEHFDAARTLAWQRRFERT